MVFLLSTRTKTYFRWSWNIVTCDTRHILGLCQNLIIFSTLWVWGVCNVCMACSAKIRSHNDNSWGMFPDCMVSSEPSYLSPTSKHGIIQWKGNDGQYSEIRGLQSVVCAEQKILLSLKREMTWDSLRKRVGRGSTIILNTLIKNRQPANTRKV